MQSRFLATARPDQQGQFQIRNLPPETYLAVALEYVDEGDATDPEFLEKLRPQATKVTLGEGETKGIELKIARIES